MRWGWYGRGDPTASIRRSPTVILKAKKSAFQCILIDQAKDCSHEGGLAAIYELLL